MQLEDEDELFFSSLLILSFLFYLYAIFICFLWNVVVTVQALVRWKQVKVHLFVKSLLTAKVGIVVFH